MGGVLFTFDWDWTGAERYLKRAIELSPNSAEALNAYGEFLTARERFDEAIAIQKRALALDSLSPALHVDLAWTYHNAGQFERAMPELAKALELDANYFQGHFLLAWNYQHMGKTNEALGEFKTSIQLDPESPTGRMGLGYALAVGGQHSEALQILSDLNQMATRRYVTRWAQSHIYLGLGQKDIALDWLDKAYEDRDSMMTLLKVDPGTIPLRSEPRFQALVKKVENGGKEK